MATIDLQFTAAPVSGFKQRDPRKGEADISSRLKKTMAKEQSKTATLGKVLDTATNIAFQQEALRDERELQLAGLNMSAAESARIEATDDQLYYDGDSIPDSINVRGGRYVKDGDGERPRKIPRWEIEPDLLRAQGIDDLESSASHITNNRLREKFMASGRESIENTYQRNLINSFAEQKQHMRLELDTEVAELARRGKYSEAGTLIDTTSLLTNEERAAAKKGVVKGEEIYTAKTLIAKQDLTLEERDGIERIVEQLGDDKKYDGALSQEERIGLQNSLKAKLSQDQSEKDAEFYRERGQIISDLHVGIAKGNQAIDEGTIQRQYDQGILTPSEMTSMKKALIDKRKKLEQEYKSRLEYTLRVDNNAGVDPNNADFKKFNDEDFEEALRQTMEATGQLTPQDFYNVGVQQMRRTGIAPSQVISEMRGANREDAESLIMAAEAFNAVVDYAPQSLNDFPEHATSLVSSVAARTKMGLTPAAAVQSAITDRDLSSGEREIKKNLLAQAKKVDKSGQSATTIDLRDKLNADENFQIPFKFSDTAPSNASQGRMQQDDLPAEMIGSFEMLIESYLPIEGYNYSAASQKAYDEIKRTWGSTNINSPDTSALMPGQRGFQLMPYAPKGDPQLMHNDLQQAMGENLPEGETAVLSYDFITIRQGDAGETVTYPAWRVDADGIPFLLPDRWSWDQVAATEAQNKKFLKEAKEKRKLLEEKRKHEEEFDLTTRTYPEIDRDVYLGN